MKPINPPVAIRLEFIGFDAPWLIRHRPGRTEPATSSSGGRQAYRGGAEARGGRGARRSAGAHRPHLLGDHRGAAAGRACQGLEEGRVMACVRKRGSGRLRWVLDYRDQQGRRHWETTKGNRKEAERLLAERVRRDLPRHLPGARRAGELRGPGASLPEARRGTTFGKRPSRTTAAT